MTHNANLKDPGFFTIGWGKDFDVQGSKDWLQDHWYIPMLFSFAFYLPMIKFGPIIMKNREPIKLKYTLFIWNGALAIFSILGFIHTLPELIYTTKTYGLFHSVCYNSFLQYKSVAFWHFLFALSKIPELLDTLFLVLRKQNLIFLHTYHHCTVVPLGWFHFAQGGSGARWYNTMNFGIHSLMYSYFALKCIPNIIKVPKSISMVITTLQTIQMIIGSHVVFFKLYTKMFTDNRCDVVYWLGFSGGFVYISFFYLFSKFFYDAYIKKAKPVTSDKERKRE